MFWGQSSSDLFTTNMQGELRWWRLPAALSSSDRSAGNQQEQPVPRLVAIAQSPFCKRIRCLDGDLYGRGMLVAGDQKGNIIAFQVAPPGEDGPFEYIFIFLPLLRPETPPDFACLLLHPPPPPPAPPPPPRSPSVQSSGRCVGQAGTMAICLLPYWKD